MVSVSGIRGIFGTGLTPLNLSLYASAFGTWLGGGTVVVGRDSRTTGALCERIVVSSLQATGCNVIQVGIVPTPTVAMAVLHHKARGGIILSASHNPAEWNALKLLNSKSEFLDADQGHEVMAIAGEQRLSFCSHDEIGQLWHNDTVVESHIDTIVNLPYIHPERIAEKKFKVAFDAVNGAGSIAVPRLLERLGVTQITSINATPDGHFAHNPEPIPEHLDEIRELVKSSGSDLGMVTDPDADRLALVDEFGALTGEEYTQALAADFMLRQRPGPVATNLSSSRAMDDIAARYAQSCHRAPVGEIHVVKKMQQTGAVIGGEGNGGVILPDLHYGRDALAGIALVLQHMANENRTLSQLRGDLPDYVIYKTRLPAADVDVKAVFEQLGQRYSNENITTDDGLKIDFSDGWVHLRASNTEPIVRIYSESTTAARARELAEQVASQIG